MGGAQHCVLEFVVQQYFICSALYLKSNMLLWRKKNVPRTHKSAVVLRLGLLMSERLAEV